MRQARCFLVIAEDPGRLTLLSTTLHRKFPNSVVQTCRDSEAAIAAVAAQKLDAIVAHRSTDMDEIPLWEQLRAATGVPIVALSNLRHQDAAKRAGASRFPHLEPWLLVGTVVAEVIHARVD